MERERDGEIYIAVLANNRPRISSRFILAIRVESLWPNFWLKLSTAFEAGCRFYENQLLWSKSLPPPFSLPLLSLSLFRYLRELVPRLHVPRAYEYQLPTGLPSRAYVLLPNIPNTLPIILPSSDLTSFARLRL